MTDKEIHERLQDGEIELTDNPWEAIYIMRDGSLISGNFSYGSRGDDHRIIEYIFDDINRYSKGFWDQMFKRTGMIMLIPETMQALVPDFIVPTTQQRSILNELEYEIVTE